MKALGEALEKDGDVDGAIENYRKAIELDPEYKDVSCNLGKALLKVGDMKGAVDNLCRAFDIDPED